MVETERTLNTLRIDNYTLTERYKPCRHPTKSCSTQRGSALDQELLATGCSRPCRHSTNELLARNAELAALRNSRAFRLLHTLRHEPLSLRKLAKVAYLLSAMTMPNRLKARLRPWRMG